MPIKNNPLKIIGLMSGTSLDGLDLVYVRLQNVGNRWKYDVLASECINYTEEFREEIRQMPFLSAEKFWAAHVDIGHFFGQATFSFMEKHQILDEVDWVVSHGQTIFHQPKLGYTAQIGCGAAVSASAKKNVVCDLRSMDIAFGGQGAPLVPVGEHFLFDDYKIFLNLGGIANISFHQENKISAFDISPANTLLNYFTNKINLAYDQDGEIAKSGSIDNTLLDFWNEQSFYKQDIPRSLHTDYILKHFILPFDFSYLNTEDILKTAVEHIAYTISKSFELLNINDLKNNKMMITGGGALNCYLIDRIKYYVPFEIYLPNQETILYKEAIIMAFLGGLRTLEIENCFSSVTGANRNVIGGAIYLNHLSKK